MQSSNLETENIGSDSLESFNDDLSRHFAVISLSLVLWMALGERITRRMTNLPLLRGTDELEIRDRVSVLLLLALIPTCALLGTASHKTTQNQRIQSLINWIAISSLILSFSWVTHYRKDSIGLIWSGFGEKIGLVAILGVFVLIVLQNLTAFTDTINTAVIQRVFHPFAFIISVGFYIPSIFQFPNGITDLHATNWSLNEFIAPVTGHIPFSNFTSQYTSLLGLPLVVVKIVASNSAIPMIATIWVDALIAFEIYLIARLIKQIFPHLLFWFCFAIPTVLIFVKVQPNEVQGSSIAAAMTAMPSRTLLPIVALTFLVKWVVEKSIRRRLILAITTGLVTGFTLINNFEFGFTAAVSVFVIVFLNSIWSTRSIKLSEVAAFIASFVGSFLVFKLGMLMTGNELHASRSIAFTRTFGKQGFGNIPMPKFGLFIFFYSILAVAAIVGLRSSKWFSLTITDGLERKAQVISVFVGIWSSVSLFYYAGRSTNASQLQIFLIPLSLAIFSILRIQHARSHSTGKGTFSGFLRGGSPITFFLSVLPIVALMQAPSPSYEFRRWTQSEFVWTVESVRSSAAGKAVMEYIRENPNSRVGYFGKNPNLTQLALGVQSVLGVNDPFDLWMSATIRDLACADISKYQVDVVVIPVGQVPERERLMLCAPEGLRYVGLSSDNVLDIYNFNP